MAAPRFTPGMIPQPAVEKARAAGLPISNLHELDFGTLDALVLSPGVPLTHPEPHWTVLKARHAGIEVIGDTEIFAREAMAAGARIVAITGTNGKSTTTALAGHVLAAGGLDVDVGGNIGKAVFLLRQPVKDRVYVLELSSFQIDLMPGLAPRGRHPDQSDARPSRPARQHGKLRRRQGPHVRQAGRWRYLALRRR